MSGTTLANTQPERQFRQQLRCHQRAVNTLSSLYPTATSLYSSRSAMQTADYPQPVRFTNVDQIVAKAASETKIPQAMAQITRAAARTAPHPRRATTTTSASAT